MISTLVIVIVVLALLLALAVAKIERLYRKHRHRRWLFHLRTKVTPAALTDVDPRFAPGTFGTRRETEVRLIGGPAYGGTDTYEAWILAVLAQTAQRLFEFGTCTGRTAYAWARNSPPEAKITTLTLSPESQQSYRAAAQDQPSDQQVALRESCFLDFYYTGTEVEPKIEQLFGDSKEFDETPYLGRIDLAFIDGSHAYSYVANDTAKALRMVRPGGMVLWHDYGDPCRAPGVFRFLNELSARLPLRQIEGTTLVYYRVPAEAPGQGGAI